MWIEAISGGGVTPTPITPSNTTPASMTSGTAYEPTANGYAISSYSSLTPSSTPANISSGSIYKAGGSGYAIDGYVTVTPTTSGIYFTSGMKKMSSSGYAYSQIPKRVQTGSYTTSYANSVTINLDFTPSLVIVYSNINTTTFAFIAISENKGAFSGWNMNNTAAAHNIGTFTWSGDSFTHKAYSSAMGNKTAYYVAIE